MRSSRLVIVPLLMAMVILGGCQMNKQTGGTLLGGGLGGLLGSQFGKGKGKLAMVALGVLGGAFVGNRIGQSLDRADQLAAQRTQATAINYNPIGQTSTWQNPNRGTYGTTTPTRTYQRPSGQYCREYQTTVTIGGRTERMYGTACHQPDGSWKASN